MKWSNQSWDNKLFSIIVYIVLILLAIVCLVPFINILALSLSGAEAVNRGDVFLIPKDISFSVYESLLNNKAYIRSMVITILLTLVYVIVTLVMTICCAYPLSEPELKGKKIIIPFIMFTMYFSGGMIPGYVLIHKLGLIDSYWSLIIPGAISTYNMIVMRTFFMGIPISLRESARIDGAGDFTILLKIVLPLSKPVLATISLYYAVGRWNGMSDALLYINDPKKKVLQIYLKQMIESVNGFNEILAGTVVEVPPVLETVRSGALVVSMIPVLIIYPVLQKYFVKGAMVGSLKG